MRRTLTALRHVAVRSTHQGAVEAAGRRQGYRRAQHPLPGSEDPEMAALRAQQKEKLAGRYDTQRYMDIEHRFGQGDYPEMPSLAVTKAAVTRWRPIQVFWDILVRKNEDYRYESLHHHLQLFGTAVAWHHFGADVLEESHGVWYAATTVNYPAGADPTRRIRVNIRWRVRPEVRREYANVVLVARLPDRLLALQWEKGAGVTRADARYEVVEVSAFYEALTGAFVVQNRVGTVLANLCDTEEQTEPTEEDFAEHAATAEGMEAAPVGDAVPAQGQAWTQKQQQVWEQQQRGWEQQQQQQQAWAQHQQGWEEQQQQQQAWAQQQQSWKQQKQQQQQQLKTQQEQQQELAWLQQQQQGWEKQMQRRPRAEQRRGHQTERRRRNNSTDEL